MKLVFTEKHEELLQPIGMTLQQLQELDLVNPTKVNDIIHEFINPLIIDGNDETSELADDLITMIREWLPGQTEAEYTDNVEE